MKPSLTFAIPATMLGLLMGSTGASASWVLDITAVIGGEELKVGEVAHSGSTCNLFCNYTSSVPTQLKLDFLFPKAGGGTYEFDEDDLYSFQYQNFSGQRLHVRMSLDLNHGYGINTTDVNQPGDQKNFGEFLNGGTHEIFFWVNGSFNGDDYVPGEETETPVSPVPLPAALPLYGSALALIGLTGWRTRKRRQIL